jgi:hypothetical protein
MFDPTLPQDPKGTMLSIGFVDPGAGWLLERICLVAALLLQAHSHQKAVW